MRGRNGHWVPPRSYQQLIIVDKGKSQFNPVECNWIYQSHIRAITLPRKSWQTQTELYLCAHACLCRFMFLVWFWHFYLTIFSLALRVFLFVCFILFHFYLFYFVFYFSLIEKHTERKNTKLGATRNEDILKRNLCHPPSLCLVLKQWIAIHWNSSWNIMPKERKY